MTPERWRRVGDLFDEALRLAPDDRTAWLRAACGDDAELLDATARLLARDVQAERDGFLAPPSPEETATWPPDPGPEPADVAPGRGFTPYSAIQAATGSPPSLGGRDLARRRLQGLTTTCLLITLLILGWKYMVLGDPDPTQAVPYVLLTAGLGVLVALLQGPRRFSPSAFEAIELGMIGSVAAVYSFAQYRTMLDFSLRNDPIRVQLVFSHRVLVSTILILSYGIYAPASWRRAVVVVGSIALLPFATLALLLVRHPDLMRSMARLGLERGSTALAHFGFDAMLLLILAAWSTHGAYTITRLRRQAREARRLGQYRLGERLGAGGMGEVYLAEHRFLKRPCALKLIRPGFDPDGKILERFEREVRITAELSHPNTVEIYDYGRTEEGEYFYVMEYLPGLSLDRLVQRHGPLPPGRVVYLLRQVCLALAEAHAAGLVHRDIKPSNIFASRRGGADDVAKLLDFGLVRPLSADRSPDPSEEGQILGTPLFMSPEQARGDPEIDARSDVYSLGAVAYHLLTGEAPFTGGGTIGILLAVVRDPAQSPSRRRPEVPEDLDRLVLKCLEKRPDDRFPDVLTLERALAACSCVGEWDAARAADWWRTEEPATQDRRSPPTTV
ncbi:serine/threonine-protein kinase [Planctomyces sp. SH-PL62]|uniref:serine/threonine-protein kinase n=1 Tax=Planctomyces sp. SH-PL62 TaxID=1636152 RepID=UPI00078B7D93|nr:serine/threonine-protein kinase [Planctomyces sp. SH-PL62]AMV40061.1 Serine/threonine-protein kinase PknB [Planctomyces sp. SH-PL62]